MVVGYSFRKLLFDLVARGYRTQARAVAARAMRGQKTCFGQGHSTFLLAE